MLAPDGWVQILRGPRRGEVAPRQRQDKPQRTQQHSPHPLQQPSRSPQSVVANALALVSRLKSAISVLGEDNPHARPLLEALKVAKMQSDRSPDPRQDRTSSAQGSEWPSSRAEVDLRWRGYGRREAVAGIAVRRGTGSNSCAVAPSGGASVTYRRFCAGGRVFENFSESHSQEATRTVVRDRSTLRPGGPTDSPGLRGVGRKDQRTVL